MRKFIIRWEDLTEQAKREYLGFFKIMEPKVDKNGNLMLEMETK